MDRFPQTFNFFSYVCKLILKYFCGFNLVIQQWRSGVPWNKFDFNIQWDQAEKWSSEGKVYLVPTGDKPWSIPKVKIRSLNCFILWSIVWKIWTPSSRKEECIYYVMIPITKNSPFIWNTFLDDNLNFTNVSLCFPNVSLLLKVFPSMPFWVWQIKLCCRTENYFRICK